MSDYLSDGRDSWAALTLDGNPKSAGESTGRGPSAVGSGFLGGDRGLLALMTTAELQWRIRGLARERAVAPAGERRHVVGRDLLQMLRELHCRVGRPRLD